jgi:hypothetical protein
MNTQVMHEMNIRSFAGTATFPEVVMNLLQIGPGDDHIQWSAVRPDALINELEVTEYATYASPIRSPIFDPGKTSRMNVAHFMADLITNESLWNAWKGQMPVIYNKAHASGSADD